MTTTTSSTGAGAATGRRSAWKAVAPVVFAHFTVDLAAGAFLATLPATVERLGENGATFGLLVALFSITALGLQPVLGRVADRFGLQTTTALAGAGSALVLMAAIAAPSLGVLMLGTVGGGLASGAFHPAGAALTRRVATVRPAAAVAAFAAAGTLGLAVGPIAGIALVGRNGQRLDTLLLAIPALVVAVVLARGSKPVTTPQPERLPVARIVRTLGRTAVAAILVSIAATVIASTVPLLIARQPGGTSTDIAIGVALATFSLSMAVGGLVGSALVNHLTPAVLVPIGLATGAVAGTLALLARPGGTAFFALLAVTGVAIGPAIPLLLIAAQDRLPESQATASGVVLGFANGIAGIAFLAIASTHGTFGLAGGALVAIAGLVPAAALIRSGARLTPHVPHVPRLMCHVTTCGCVLPAFEVTTP